MTYYLLFINNYILYFGKLIIRIMKTEQFLKLMNVASWMIFVFLCMEAGTSFFTVLTEFLYSNEKEPPFSVGLSGLYTFHSNHFYVIVLFVLLVTILKALIFWRVIKLFSSLNLHHPFSPEISKLLERICFLTFCTGIIAAFGNFYTKWLNKFYSLGQVGLGNGTDLLFMAGVLFVFYLLFKRGLEIQNDQELTI